MTAVSFARSVAEGRSEFSWAALEKNAFADQEGVRETLAASDADLSRRPPSGLSVALTMVTTLALEIWPLIAAGLVITPGRLDADPTIPTVVAGLGALVYIASRAILVQRIVRGRGEVSMSRALLSAVATMFGALASGVCWLSIHRLDGGWIWLAILVTMTIASAVATVAALLRIRRFGPTSDGAGMLDRLHEAIDVLSEREREAISVDIGHAIDLLVARQIISGTDAEVARNTPLGGLARWGVGADAIAFSGVS